MKLPVKVGTNMAYEEEMDGNKLEISFAEAMNEFRKNL